LPKGLKACKIQYKTKNQTENHVSIEKTIVNKNIDTLNDFYLVNELEFEGKRG
jgi:hypothetical protein